MTQFELYLGGKEGESLIPLSLLESFISEVADRHLESFTVIQGLGRWKGQAEPTTIIRVMADSPEVTATINALRSIGEAYKQSFNQENVFITQYQITGGLF